MQKGVPRDRRVTTVVLPTNEAFDPEVIVHELGHVLHEQLRFEPHAAAVTPYAKTDRWEAFAEAFRLWVRWGNWVIDARTQAQLTSVAEESAWSPPAWPNSPVDF